MKIKSSILSPLFIISLGVLILNDMVLKQAYGNFLTGKLSDFAGLIVFPVFVASIFPGTKKYVSVATGILFVIWKTPLATSFIELTNQHSPFTIQRIIDYSDYWALLVLPVAHRLINSDEKLTGYHRLAAGIKFSLSIVSVFAICATTMPPPYEIPKGTIYIGKSYTLKKSKQNIIDLIKSQGFNVDYYENKKDSTNINHRSISLPYYQTDTIIIQDEYPAKTDTILNVKYRLTEIDKNKTKIEIINVTLSEEGNIQRWQTLKYLRKQYKKKIEKAIFDNIEVH